MNIRPGGFNVLPPVVKNLLIINGLFFLATITLEQKGIDLSQYLGIHYFTSEYFKPYQYITYMFMHGSFTHILFNMFALWMFGATIENYWGAKRFLIYYFVTGIGAALIQTGVNWYTISSMQTAVEAYLAMPTPETFAILINEHFSSFPINPEFIKQWAIDPSNAGAISQTTSYIENATKTIVNVPTVGASGAVFGLLLAFGMLFPNSIIYVYFALPIKAKYFVIIYGAIELYSSFANQVGDHVAHFAHLGGMIFGVFLILYWKKNYV